MSTKHTSGPWEYYPEQIDPRHGRIAGRSPEVRMLNGLNVAKVCRFTSGKGRCASAEANARLIAASPSMLHLLRASLPQLRWADCHGSRCPELIEAIEAAIAKAEGKEGAK